MLYFVNLKELSAMYFNRILIVGVFFLQSVALFAQPTQFSPGFTWRAYNDTIPPNSCPAKLCHNNPMVAWNDKYQEFAAWRSANGDPNLASSFMNFRVVFPPGYNQADATKKYPIIFMLHGGGESGRTWEGRFVYAFTDSLIDNNSHQLKHGGNEHQLAVNRPASDPRAFPGIVVFPQVNSSGSWSGGWENGVLGQNQELLIDIINYMLAQYNADINRITIHGLSNGARGTWDTSTKRPDLFASVLAMSGIPFETDIAAAIHSTTPVRLYQGGLDANPSPGGSQAMIDKLVAQGGAPQYYLYPNNGHNTWVSAYSEPDFFSWILAQDKRRIYVFGANTQICAGASKKLGFSAGFTAYRWLKDGVAIPSETTRFLTTNTPGTYLVEFQRPGDPLTWHQSFPVVITFQSASTFTPLLTSIGSLMLPFTRENGTNIGAIGNTSTVLYAPPGYPEYYWQKNGVAITGNIVNGSNTTVAAITSNNMRISYQAGSAANAGNYAVVVKENSGCLSNVSNVKTLFYNPATSAPFHSFPNQNPFPPNAVYFTGIGRPTVVPLSEKSMRITWADNTNEEYFEIWRYRRSGGNPNYPTQASYLMIATVAANTTTYIDQTGLRPFAEYQYVIRGIANGDGRFSDKSSTAPWPRTLDDFVSPSSPKDLTVISTSETTIRISWTASTDNDVVYRYEVFAGKDSVTSLINDLVGDNTDGNPPPPTSYTFTGLEPATPYLLNVRAVDFRGNKSAFAEPLNASTLNPINGVIFKYWPYTFPGTVTNGTQLRETPGADPFDFTQTPNQTGVVNNFSIAGANTFQNLVDPDNFVYSFDSYIQIDVPGIYTFWTRTGEGSRLYINGGLIINNDGRTGARIRSGIFDFTTAGKFPIRVTYFEGTGPQSFGVKYRAGNFNGQNSNANYAAAIFIPDNKLWTSGLTFTNYYSKATGDLSALATWGTNADGTGTSPLNFTTNYQFFYIANRVAVTQASPWVVSGTSSRVLVGDNISLTLNAATTAKLYANAGSTITLNNATFPTFVELDPTSTVNMNVGGTISAAVYGNLNLKTGATIKTLPRNTASIKGNLIVDDQVTFKGSINNQSTLLVYGDITFNGTSGNPLTATERYSLIFRGNQPHTINVNQYDLFLQSLELDFNSELNLAFNSIAPKTITVGRAGSSSGLLLHSGSTMQLGQNNLVVLGNYGINPTDDSGEINMNGGNLTLNTTTSQTSSLYFAGNSVLGNLTVAMTGSGQLNVLNNSLLKNLMTLSTGTVNLFGNFVLNSEATGTARIGPLLSGARINGNVTFRRFMEGEGKIYRYISSPIKGFRVADMQNYIPVKGNFTGTNGAGTSLFHWVSTAYQNFPLNGGTNQDTLKRGKGYVIFVEAAVTPTTWQATGPMHQGTIPFVLTPGTISPNDGWNLLGNPYAAPIQWTGVQGAQWPSFQNISQTVFIRENFVLNGVSQYRWQVYNPNIVPTGQFYTPFDGAIAPGQAFWIQTLTSPSLTVAENAKQTTDRSFFRSADDDRKDVLSITMKNDAVSDVAYILYTDKSTENYDKIWDAGKAENSLFNISTLSKDNIALAINATPEIYCEKETRLNITNAAAGNYSLSFQGLESFRRLVKMHLKDNFTGSLTEITPDFIYNFTITASAATKGSGRFVIQEKPLLKNSVSLNSDPVCEVDPTILIVDAQPGASYQAFFNGKAVSQIVTATSDSTPVVLDKKLLGIGTRSITLAASYGNCAGLVQNQVAKVQIDSLIAPAIRLAAGVLLTNINQGDRYQWFFDGEILEKETSGTLTPLAAGTYEVEVSSKTCTKKSPGFIFSVTAIEESERSQAGVYPNPFTDRLMVVLDENENVKSIVTSNMLGQTLKYMEVEPAGKREVELDLSDLPTGSYIIVVGARRYKVIKQQ